MLDEKYIKAVAAAAAEAGNSPNKRSAYAEVVIDVVQPNQLTLDLFSAFMPTVSLNVGDEWGRRVKRGRYPVRTMVPGSKHLTDVTSYVEQYATFYDRLIAGTSHSLWEIQNGEVGTVEQMRTDLRADIFSELVSKVFNILATAWNETDTPDNFEDVGGPLTQTALDSMIEAMLDNGQNVTGIMGTRRALRPLYTFAQYREFELSGTNTDAVGFAVDQAFNEFTNSRRVSRYTGIPVIELAQVSSRRFAPGATSGDLRGERLLPDNRVIILSEDVGQIATFGETTYQDYTDPQTQPPNYVLHCWQAYGMRVDNMEGIGVLAVNPS